MLRADDPHFIAVRRDLLHEHLRGVVKGWHKHREMTLNYACIFGRVKLVLYDDRPDSPTAGIAVELFLGPDDHSLVDDPAGDLDAASRA